MVFLPHPLVFTPASPPRSIVFAMLGIGEGVSAMLLSCFCGVVVEDESGGQMDELTRAPVTTAVDGDSYEAALGLRLIRGLMQRSALEHSETVRWTERKPCSKRVTLKPTS